MQNFIYLIKIKAKEEKISAIVNTQVQIDSTRIFVLVRAKELISFLDLLSLVKFYKTFF